VRVPPFARVKPTHAVSPADYQTLRPRIEALHDAHKQDIELAASLEKRTAALIKQYGMHVSRRKPRTSLDLRVGAFGPLPSSFLLQVGALSELFVAWDDAIREAEDQVAKLERDQAERRRLGYE